MSQFETLVTIKQDDKVVWICRRPSEKFPLLVRVQLEDREEPVDFELSANDLIQLLGL